MSKKIVRNIIIVAVILFGIYNLIWYWGMYRPCLAYEGEFSEFEDSGDYMLIDEEDYQYSVKTPDYLQWTGNLGITNSELSPALIIWVGFGGKVDSTGIMIKNAADDVEQIELTQDRKAVYSEQEQLVDSNKSVINDMFERAEKIWSLEI